MPDRQHTGIGGSSMGGLISVYCGFIFPELFGKMMIFSPSLWLAPKIYFHAINFFNPFQTKIYLYGGGKEGANMVGNIQRLRSALQRKGLDGSKIEFNVSIDPDGEHSEDHWGREFPKAIDWLYFSNGKQ
jgi:predicted alpha/beta superfamily hydrolase